MIEMLKIRLPNGELYNRVKNSYKLYHAVKNQPKLDYIAKEAFKYYFGKYFKGSKNTQFSHILFPNLLINNEYYDFDIIKVPADELGSMVNLYDIVFPYIFSDYMEYLEPLQYEGSYEQYGVTIDIDDVVLDFGANLGMFTAVAANKGAKVYAFEPVKSTIKALEKTIAVNNIAENTIIVDKGVSNKTESVFINISEFRSVNSIVMNEDSTEKEEIQVITLDEFIEETQLKKLDFIKADIEGAERLMLEGAKNTLKKFKPKLAICTYHFPDDKEVLTDLILSANPSYEISYSKMKLFAK